MSAVEPAVFWITPENVLVALLSPTVSVGVPPVPSTVPAPESPLIVSLNPPRESRPARLTLPNPGPFGTWLAAPSASVLRASTVVFPW